MKQVYSKEVQYQLNDIDKQIYDIEVSMVKKVNESATDCKNLKKLKEEYLHRIEPLQKIKFDILVYSVPNILISNEEYENMIN
jgi:hypothetical protein